MAPERWEPPRLCLLHGPAAWWSLCSPQNAPPLCPSSLEKVCYRLAGPSSPHIRLTWLLTSHGFNYCLVTKDSPVHISSPSPARLQPLRDSCLLSVPGGPLQGHPRPAMSRTEPLVGLPSPGAPLEFAVSGSPKPAQVRGRPGYFSHPSACPSLHPVGYA